MPSLYQGKAQPLNDAGLESILDLLHLHAAELWAVLTVETLGCGFLADRRPKILFERHIFSQQTQKKYDKSHPEISNQHAGGYGKGGADQYIRLAQAALLDTQAALKSTSWGMGQVMGFNAEIAGFKDVEEMVATMQDDENQQLHAMAQFIQAKALQKSLQQHNWSQFAKAYNGSNYAINHYDTRLAAAYQKFAYGQLPDLELRRAQIYLSFLDYDPGPIDGSMGRLTRSALNLFQAQHKLSISDDLHQGALTVLQHEVSQLTA